ncbi:MAG: apolipoprotein N-acyltransferase, partial [Betaproteobacteria bacterium]
FKQAFSDLTNNRGSNIVYGIPEKSNDGKFFNSVMSVGVSGEQTYRKHHLVPFGDYFPTWQPITWIMQSLSIPMSNFSRGEKYQSPIRAGSQKIAVNICYEDVFGEEIIRQLPDATVLANFTNDAWWGDSLGPKQHLQIAQTRALETGREMLRVTNTGMTAIIGHDGYILSSIPQFEKQTLRGVIQGRTGQTPYVKYGNLLFLGMCAIVALAGLAWHRLFHARTR